MDPTPCKMFDVIRECSNAKYWVFSTGLVSLSIRAHFLFHFFLDKCDCFYYTRFPPERTKGSQVHNILIQMFSFADDLARTLKEGRFWSQVQKMADWKEKFTTSDLPCELFYVIEGKPEQYVVNCKDGCQGVGMCKNPSLIQVKVGQPACRSIRIVLSSWKKKAYMFLAHLS